MQLMQTVGGVDLAYYVLCKRKLWLYKKGIGMEEESDRVMQGKVLHETSYTRLEKKEILIDGAFKIDALDGEYVREVKISSKMMESDKMQMLFYLYQLALRGIDKKGLISYTKEKKTVEIVLTNEKQQEVKQAIAGVYQVIDELSPPKVVKVPYCKSCAYFGFCYAREVDEDDA
ncbi:CRISPR-associated protein Cas4 [Aneurinibacillus terranovensis]|uniref:CRISPR-associated protein Cas4 n=1 Tax=Aneurinibacillus terranovensis TaxID=278991 RepID=UPI0004251DD6|nr:CRISPR-associated protein Cas4 [Aneurinibacillus terranovensis]